MSIGSTAAFYKPIATECLFISTFPSVALYLLRNNGNYILYKSDEVGLTASDQERFLKSNIQTVYIRSGDSEVVHSFLEELARTVFQRNDISTETKELILSTVTFNYLNEVFNSPEKIADVKRCKKLLKSLFSKMVTKECLMQSLAKVMDGNYQIFRHSVDVTVLTMLAHEAILELQGDELLEVGVGAMFHDVGIIFLTSNSLEGAYPTTDIDYSRIKLHPKMGYNLLLPLWGDQYGVALDIVRYHHERFDGGGYPNALTGERIPRGAQIAAICDIFSSLTTDRPFRKASLPKYALDIMESESSIFNKEYLKAFKKMILHNSSSST